MIPRIGRKGDLTVGEVLSAILAIIGFLLIIYGIVALYNIFGDNEKTNAKNTLENIAGRLEALEAGQSSTFLLQGFSDAPDWGVMAWNNTQLGRPDKCYFKSCLCVCPIEGDDAESCQQKGFCQTFDYVGVVVEPLSGAKVGDDIQYPLPTNADECKINVVASGSSSFAVVQLNPQEA